LTNNVYKVDLFTGQVLQKYDLSELKQKQKDYLNEIGDKNYYDWGNNVLNGIAHRKDTDTIIFTGKMWDLAFELKLN
jgi:glutamine cyclotransferase